MDRRQWSRLTKLGMGVMAFNSGLAIYSSLGDAASVAFVLLADAALLLLFLCLGRLELERAAARGRGAAPGRHGSSWQLKAAVWALTTLLTAMFASRVALLMPLAVGVLVLVCLREVDDQLVHRGGGRIINMGVQYAALAKVGFAVLTCSSALDTYYYDARRPDTGSAALVLVSYAVLVILTGLLVRGFARAEQGAAAAE